MKRRYWNTISATSAVLSLGWCAAGVYFLSEGKATFSEVAGTVGPLIGVWIGLLVQMVRGDVDES